MAVTYDLNEAMNRLPPIQKAAMKTLTPQVLCDSVPYWPYVQDAHPYWFNRIDNMIIDTSVAQDIEIHDYTITMALVIGHLIDTGYKGEQPALAYQWIVPILNYFKDTERQYLMSDEYPERFDWVWIPHGGARITGIPGGTRTLTNSGTGVSQLAIVFSLDLPLLWRLY